MSRKLDWHPVQKEFNYIMRKIIRNGKYSQTMNDLIYSEWKAHDVAYKLSGDIVAKAWADAWDILEQLNLNIEEIISSDEDRSYDVIKCGVDSLKRRVDGVDWTEEG